MPYDPSAKSLALYICALIANWFLGHNCVSPPDHVRFFDAIKPTFMFLSVPGYSNGSWLILPFISLAACLSCWTDAQYLCSHSEPAPNS